MVIQMFSVLFIVYYLILLCAPNNDPNSNQPRKRHALEELISEFIHFECILIFQFSN